jgi:hypothetical protein
LTHGIEMVEGFLQAEIFKVVAKRFDAKKSGELFVHPQHGAFRAGAQHVVSMVDLLQHGLELPAKSFVETETKDIGNFIGGQAHQSDIAGALIELMDREVAFENEVAAVFHLLDRKHAVQIDRFTFLLGEPGAQNQTPIVELLADDVRAQAVGGGL